MPSTSPEAQLFNPDPAAYLPHRSPFLFLDRIVSLESGVSATALRRVSCDDPVFSHLLLIESMAQLGGIAAAREDGGGGILASIDRAEFHERIAPGDTLLVSVRIVKSFGQLHLVEGEVTCEGVRLAAAVLALKVGVMP